jgi:hypothetical protein
MPFAMLLFTTRTIPEAAAEAVVPNGSAISAVTARIAASRSSCISPPINDSTPIRPSTRSASVTVGSAPPLL